jgi:hypothetical protein
MAVLLAVLSLVLLPFSTVNAQLDSEAAGDRRPLMRAHSQRGDDPSAMIHLSPAGDFVEVHTHRVAGAGRHRNDPATADDDLCKYSFLLGKPDTNDCLDTTKHENIEDQEDCKFAATQAGACHGPCGGCVTEMNIGLDCNGTERLDATGPNGRYNTHPIGCFKSKTANEYYYNPWVGTPRRPEINGGTPVCQRARFVLGNPGEDDGCPDDTSKGDSYAKITDLDFCRTAAECQGYEVDDNYFLVGIAPPANNNDRRPAWMRTYNGKPKGCYLKNDVGYAYFNQPQASTPAGIEISTTPICSIRRFAH